MFCTDCGKKLIDGAKFCPFCGAHVILPVSIKTDTEKSDMGRKTERKNKFSGSSNEQTFDIGKGIDYHKTERKRIHLEIPKTQGGGSFSCIAVNRIFAGGGMKIWFESEIGEQISDEYTEGRIIAIHANTIVCKSNVNNHYFILIYHSSGTFSYLGGITKLQYSKYATDFAFYPNTYRNHSFENKPISKSGFYFIDNTIVSIDTLKKYTFSIKKINLGMEIWECFFASLYIVVAVIGVTHGALELSGAEIGNTILFILGFPVFIITLVCFIMRANDYKIITIFKQMN